MQPHESPDIRSALIVVDMQRAIFHGPARPHDDDFVVRRICALIDRARREEVQIVFVQHCSPEGTPCAYGTEGWRLIDALQPQFPDWVVQKTQPSIFLHTNLEAQLKAIGITRLILAGAKTDYCIDTSCRVASELGFEVVLAGDAHTTIDSEARPAADIIAHHNAELGGPFAKVQPVQDIAFA